MKIFFLVSISLAITLSSEKVLAEAKVVSCKNEKGPTKSLLFEEGADHFFLDIQDTRFGETFSGLLTEVNGDYLIQARFSKKRGGSEFPSCYFSQEEPLFIQCTILQKGVVTLTHLSTQEQKTFEAVFHFLNAHRLKKDLLSVGTVPNSKDPFEPGLQSVEKLSFLFFITLKNGNAIQAKSEFDFSNCSNQPPAEIPARP